MGLFNKKELKEIAELRNKVNRYENRGIYDTYQNPIYGSLNFIQGTSYSTSKSLQLSTVYRCVNLISSSIASTPIYPYIFKENWKYIDESNSLYNILNVQPNDLMGAFTFKDLMVKSALLTGKALIKVEFDKAHKTKKLTLLNALNYKAEVINNELKYVSLDDSKEILNNEDVICILNYTSDGINGISTITHAVTTLGIAYDSDQHAGNFFKGGGALQGILTPKAGGQIGPDKATKAKEAFVGANNTTTNLPTNNVVVMEAGMEYQPISVSPVDAQLLETRQFSVIEICRFFNVPPSLAFSESGKFSTAEQQQIDYLNNCLAPLIEKIENEFFRKLYLPSEWSENELRFDVENLLRLDAVTKANYLTQLFNVGGLTTNEIREKINAKNPVKGGNRAFIQVNLQPTDALISEQPLVNPEAPIDNQVKNNNNNNGQ